MKKSMIILAFFMLLVTLYSASAYDVIHDSGLFVGNATLAAWSSCAGGGCNDSDDWDVNNVIDGSIAVNAKAEWASAQNQATNAYVVVKLGKTYNISMINITNAKKNAGDSGSMGIKKINISCNDSTISGKFKPLIYDSINQSGSKMFNLTGDNDCLYIKVSCQVPMDSEYCGFSEIWVNVTEGATTPPVGGTNNYTISYNTEPYEAKNTNLYLQLYNVTAITSSSANCTFNGTIYNATKINDTYFQCSRYVPSIDTNATLKLQGNFTYTIANATYSEKKNTTHVNLTPIFSVNVEPMSPFRKSPVIETSTDIIGFDMTLQPGINITPTNVTLHYINNYYVMYENDSNYTVSLVIPLVNTSNNYTVNYTFIYQIMNNDSTERRARNYTTGINISQMVFRMNLTNCSPGSDNIVLNITIDDEPSLLDITSNLELFLELHTGNKSNNRSFTARLENQSQYYICQNTNLTFILDGYFRNIVNFTHKNYFINQTVNSSVYNEDAYNYNDTTGISDLKLIVRDRITYSYMDNIIAKLQRKYVDPPVWRTVQMDKSDNYGLLFYNIKEEDVDYRLLFFDEFGRQLDTTESMKFVCTAGVCEITFLLDEWSPEELPDNLTVGWYYDNATSKIHVWWNDLAGRNANIRSIVSKETMEESIEICNNYTAQTSEGNHTCDISGYTGKILVRIRSSRSPWTDEIADWFDVVFQPLENVIGRQEGLFWTFVVASATLGFGIVTGVVGAMVTMFVGILVMWWFGVLTVIDTTFIILAFVIAIAIALKIKK